jgi:hypothetical protein
MCGSGPAPLATLLLILELSAAGSQMCGTPQSCRAGSFTLGGRLSHAGRTPSAPLRGLRLRGGSGWLFNPKLCPEGWANQAVIHWRGRPHAVPGEAVPTEPRIEQGNEVRDPIPTRCLSSASPWCVPSCIECRTRRRQTAERWTLTGQDDTDAGADAGEDGCGAAPAGVQRTNDDSTVSKRSAAEAGYFRDEYIATFCGGAPVRRAALINRGYFVRVRAVRGMLRAFAAAAAAARTPVQVLVLGAGFDSSFLQVPAAPPAAAARERPAAQAADAQRAERLRHARTAQIRGCAGLCPLV